MIRFDSDRTSVKLKVWTGVRSMVVVVDHGGVGGRSNDECKVVKLVVFMWLFSLQVYLMNIGHVEA